MVSLGALGLPIVLSAVLVFISSTIVHMVLTYHASDYRPLPNEEAVRAAIRSGNPSPGQYILPHAPDMKQMGSPEMVAKYTEGPVGVVTLKPSGRPTMGANLIQWFMFSLAISYFVAYVGSRVLPVGTEYLRVFQVVGTVAFLAYAGGTLPGAIWMGKPWSIAAKEVLDGLIYGLVTAGAFGWLWPR